MDLTTIIASVLGIIVAQALLFLLLKNKLGEHFHFLANEALVRNNQNFVQMANATLETYNQGTTPQASSSCMECHNNATTRVTQSPRTSFADFTFLLERAQSTGAKE